MFFRRLQRRAAAEIRAELGDRIVAIDERANFFGLGSSGAGQIRGNGCLAVTDDEILFRMWWPKKKIRIGRDRIASVGHTKSHLGKTVGRPLLLVSFAGDMGQEDSAAWLVTDLDSWLTILNR